MLVCWDFVLFFYGCSFSHSRLPTDGRYLTTDGDDGDDEDEDEDEDEDDDDDGYDMTYVERNAMDEPSQMSLTACCKDVYGVYALQELASLYIIHTYLYVL